MEGQCRLNVGQFRRQHEGRSDVALVGMSLHRGGVIAADSWGAQSEEMTVPPARYDVFTVKTIQVNPQSG